MCCTLPEIQQSIEHFDMKIKLRKHYDFICGHKLSNITQDKVYEVVDKWASSKFIIDDKSNRIEVSGNAFRKFFKEVEE